VILVKKVEGIKCCVLTRREHVEQDEWFISDAAGVSFITSLSACLGFKEVRLMEKDQIQVFELCKAQLDWGRKGNTYHFAARNP